MMDMGRYHGWMMDHDDKQTTNSIPTDLPGLTLITLTPHHAPDYHNLVQRNLDHLTQYGDYSELKLATLDSIAEELGDPDDDNEKFGIWLNDVLIGRADLSPRAPGHYVIGYWLGREYTGCGFATIACRALIQYGQNTLGATTIYAGVSKGNTASEALLDRLGFRQMEDRGTYTLFHLKLADT